MLSALTLVDMINIAVALLTVGLGLLGWLAPRWTMQQLDMVAGPTNMAYTEVSAVSGCLFVGLGLGAIYLNEPMGWLVMGLAAWLAAPWAVALDDAVEFALGIEIFKGNDIARGAVAHRPGAALHAQ